MNKRKNSKKMSQKDLNHLQIFIDPELHELIKIVSNIKMINLSEAIVMFLDKDKIRKYISEETKELIEKYGKS